MNRIAEIAKKLNITAEQAESLVKQELARAEAGKRYRNSQAYRDRLNLQKQVRKALKEIA